MSVNSPDLATKINSNYQDMKNWANAPINNPQEESPSVFNFAGEGVEPNSKEYNEALAMLGMGEVADKDSNGDGEISDFEYVMAELEDANFEFENAQQAFDTIWDSMYLHEVMDTAMAGGETKNDNDGTLNATEVASFYKNMDRFSDGEFKGVDTVDGQFSYDDATGFTKFLLENYEQFVTEGQLDNIDMKADALFTLLDEKGMLTIAES